jgi:hypothetical protein
VGAGRLATHVSDFRRLRRAAVRIRPAAHHTTYRLTSTSTARASNSSAGRFDVEGQPSIMAITDAAPAVPHDVREGSVAAGEASSVAIDVRERFMAQVAKIAG